jgi:hypothetical protein
MYSVYKVGDWIESIYTGELYEIIEETKFEGFKLYKVKRQRPICTGRPYEFRYNELYDNFRLNNSARVLYSNVVREITNA